jgi:protein-tyrosine phosphatase
MKILMVCLGNICRSPLAEGILKAKSEMLNLEVTVDSAGTSGWHSGERPDTRSMEVSLKHNIDIGNQRSRQISSTDFDDFDMIFAMDKSNEEDLKRMCSDSRNLSKISRILEYNQATELEEVPDPYYYGGFDFVYDLIEGACDGICEAIKRGEIHR